MTSTTDAVTIMKSDRAYERELETFFWKRVRLVGGRPFKLAPTTAGIPDRLVFFPQGKLYLVELKREGESPSPVQVVWHGRLREMGHEVIVLRGRAEILDWLRQVVDSLGPQNKKPGRRANG